MPEIVLRHLFRSDVGTTWGSFVLDEDDTSLYTVAQCGTVIRFYRYSNISETGAPYRNGYNPHEDVMVNDKAVDVRWVRLDPDAHMADPGTAQQLQQALVAAQLTGSICDLKKWGRR